jgi:hypothetical protein
MNLPQPDSGPDFNINSPYSPISWDYPFNCITMCIFVQIWYAVFYLLLDPDPSAITPKSLQKVFQIDNLLPVHGIVLLHFSSQYWTDAKVL